MGLRKRMRPAHDFSALRRTRLRVQGAARERMSSSGRSLVLLGALACILAGVVLCRSAPAQQVTAEQLDSEITRLVREIKGAQGADGSWRASASGSEISGWVLGTTSLAVLALSEAGVPPDDPALSRGLNFVLEKKAETVYEAALKIMALESIDAKRYAPQMAQPTGYLVGAQLSSGGWGYLKCRDCTRPDNSCSQFALLGLRSAARSGLDVPVGVWKAAYVYYSNRQNTDGGWGYTKADGRSYGSMTAAGTASLYICAVRLHLAERRCGSYVKEDRIQDGLEWLAKNFAVDRNPRQERMKFYYLYGLERAGVVSATRYLGTHDWYLEGVNHLVGSTQAYATKSDPFEPPLVQKCFALLFLSKGNSPVLIHKAQWPGDWNPYRYDAKFLSERCGELLKERLSWQIIPLDAPLDHLAAAPILYVSGRGEFQLTAQQVQKIVDYVQSGGFILAEANGGDTAFDRSFRRVIAEAFPEERLEPLPQGHPVYEVHHYLPPEDRVPLEALQGPCWTSLVYCPSGLSCAWDVADHEHPDFKLGVNIAAYAAGMEKLPGKLERQQMKVSAAQPEETKELEGAFVVGQLVHDGGWDSHKGVWRRVLSKAHAEAGLSLFSEPIAMDPQADDLFQAHLISITGTRALHLNEGARGRLKRYLERGGFVYAEAACGSPQFDSSFRALMQEMFPQQPLSPLPLGHLLLERGREHGDINYNWVVRKQRPELKTPALEFIELDGRAAVVYSKYDLGSAISGHPCRSCPAVLEPSASELMLSVVLYSVTE